MESVIKAFTGIFFTLLIAFLGASLISASVDSRNADAFVSDVSSDLEASNCSKRVIEKWKDSATEENKTYELTIDEPVLNPTTGRYETTVKLNYKYRVPLIGMSNEKTTTSIVR